MQMLDNLTDKHFKALKSRMDRLGQEKLIDRLENELINANLAGDAAKVKRCEQSIAWARRQNGWIVN